MWIALFIGFLTGAGLIIAIGAQNAFVLRVGLIRRHVFAVCLFCALSDALLIIAGVGGFGQFVQASPLLLNSVTIGGIAFLLWYGWSALRRAMNPQAMLAANGTIEGLRPTLAKCAAFTFLNPHVYLDTVVLVGSLSAAYDPHEAIYGAGAVVASFTWFFALGYGARLLGPLFEKPASWRVLDGIIALVMVLLALKLAMGHFWGS
jgi:L-lysine exporter family protein LysE/ArgO